MSNLKRAAFSVLVSTLMVWQSPAALAQSAPSGTEQWPIVATGATTEGSDAEPIVAQNAEAQVAQAPARSPFPYKHPIPLWRPGWEYTVDASIAAPFGATGKLKQFGLPGAMDGIIKYAFSESSRFYIAYFGLQEYPIGFNTGVVPVYLQGVAVPIATQNLGSPPGPVNSSVDNKFVIARYDQAFWIGGIPKGLIPGDKLPLVISPTYIARWGTVGGGTDLLPIEIDGLPYTLHYRTGSFLAVAATVPVPLLTKPRYGLVTLYTVGTQWLTGLSGANVSNHAQLFQILRTTWNPKEQLTIELEPSLYPNLLPTDKWPQHYLTMIYSVAYSFGKEKYDPYHRPITHNLIPFIQATVSMGGAMNLKPYGISALYCQQLSATGCNPASIVPQLGGNHAAQFQLKVGIGKPEIIQF